MPAKKIFLASSSELKNDRIAFEIFINRKNKEWHDKDVFLELVIWEDFLDTVSQTRLQDETNRVIKECDIFLMLFFTKVGKYTEEEFKAAFGQFKETNKPIIYTYFKDAAINTGSINKDILSMLAFREKLKELGHFVTIYENIQDLQLQFTNQLTKLIDDGSIQFSQPTPQQSISAPAYPKELNNNIPKTHPEDIVGREEDLKALHKHLCDDKRVVVVNGLGGIGKTTLVQAYIHKYYDEYNHIAWITQTAEDIANDFINTDGLLKNLEIETANAESKQLFSEIIRKLKSINEKPNLLIIDNAEQSLKRYKDVLPSQPHWHLLVTSREEITSFFAKPVDFLNEVQSVELFRKHYTHKKLSDDDVRELVKAVDYHTLTIEILAKTAKVQRYDVETLRNAIENDLKANVKVSRQSAEVEKIGAYLSTVFNMSKLEENETWLIKQFACLPPEFISYDLLYELTTGEENEHKETFGETLQALQEKGWLLYDADTDSYKMHRIITEVVKKQQAISTDDVKALIEAIADKLGMDYAKDNPVDKFVWAPYGKVITDNFTGDSSAEVSQLQNDLALVLKDLSDYEGAKSLLEKALASDEKNFGKDHPTTAIRYSNLATVLQDLGEYEGAKSLLEKALTSDEKNFGKNHPATAIRYSNLAIVLRVLGEYEDAKSLLEKALASAEKNFGKDHPTTAIRYSNLAIVLQDLGEYEGAKSLLEKALASAEKNFGKDHPTTAIRYSNLALVLKDLGEYEGAKSLLEKALVSAEKNFGKDHPATAIKYSNLAMVLQDLGEYEGAKSLLEKALASDEKNFGKDHPTTAINYHNLGTVFHALGDYKSAKSLLEKGMISDEENFGNQHPTTAIDYWRMATVLRDFGQYQQALEYCQKAMDIHNKTLPPNHPYIKRVNDTYESIKKKMEELS